MDPRDYFDKLPRDPKNPDPWLALYLDQSVPLTDKVKAAFLKGQHSFTRRVILPLLTPFARLSIAIIKVAGTIIPGKWQSSWLLHRSIYWGLRLFVSPEANYLICRHFNIGTEILKFIASNVPGIDIQTTIPLRPTKLEDLLDDTFTKHDLNIFNFIIELNDKLRAEGREIETAKEIDYSALTDCDIPLENFPRTSLNFVDLQTAIELYTPLYALFLSDEDFWRASNSLQLDETISLYLAKLLGTDLPITVVHNRHPMVPHTTLMAGYRLTLHGVDAEALHGFLRRAKAESEKGKSKKARTDDKTKAPEQAPEH